MKHFLTIQDFNKKEILEISDLIIKIKKDFTNNKVEKPLANKVLAMIFEKSSTRTRVSFESGMFHLGGHSIFLSINDIQLGRGESASDTSKVISSMCDFIMIRTHKHSTLEEFAKYSSVPIINGLSNDYHPTQVIADYVTLIENNKENGKIAFIGDGNNMANSWLILASKLGLDINIATPKNYEIQDNIKQTALQNAKTTNSNILFTNNPKEAIKDVDVVITDTYVSMGQEDEKKIRDLAFKDFCITKDLFNLADKEAVFLHCLPAYRDKEVSSEVIDGKRSLVFQEAENRMHTNKGILLWLEQNK